MLALTAAQPKPASLAARATAAIRSGFEWNSRPRGSSGSGGAVICAWKPSAPASRRESRAPPGARGWASRWDRARGRAPPSGGPSPRDRRDRSGRSQSTLRRVLPERRLPGPRGRRCAEIAVPASLELPSLRTLLANPCEPCLPDTPEALGIERILARTRLSAKYRTDPEFFPTDIRVKPHTVLKSVRSLKFFNGRGTYARVSWEPAGE